MKVRFKSLVFLLSIFVVTDTFAYYRPKAKGGDNGKGHETIDGKANCSPATATLNMEYNDVRAVLNTNGVLFMDKHTGTPTAGYEVPKIDVGRHTHAIFAAALWMGGTDINNQLKLAATTFGEGNDFWTGPLSATPGTGDYDPTQPVGDNAKRDYGEAAITPDQCAKYDKFYSISKAEVIQFSIWWEEQNGITPPGEIPAQQPSAQTMDRILNWPAHGDPSLGQDRYLAPFYDRPGQGESTGNGVYDPLDDGDYPWYDDILGRDDITCGSDRRISLFGDQTYWWIFNDKGNIHTSSKGDPIGMEIRAQAFAFATSDQINDMTFYNYEMINKGTQTLYNTYFAQYVDPDLGGAFDDYVGCDVSRGLGFAYNGDNFDEDYQGNAGYGANPPAIGFDFFEGPYQDADGKDNYGPHKDSTGADVPMNTHDAIADGGIVYKGLGIGYKDGIIDNERMGMKRFSYYINGAQTGMADPSTASQFYNYMSGKWSDGTDMVYGNNGYGQGGGLHADYMFPGDSDPLHWSTGGTVPPFDDWAENNKDGNGASNQPGDRRFVQAAGPFTLEPGAINNITVGVVYARSTEGDLLASVRALKVADTKAQALFDNCFEILDPPNAPTLTIQELNNQLVLMLSNPVNSNNYKEKYIQEDKIDIQDPNDSTVYDKFYRFEGYQIFQLKDQSASVADIFNTDKARLVAQCDLKNQYTKLMNFDFNEELGINIGSLKVDGENKGIRHSFLITEDKFAQGDRKLVNHKKYYYVAVAYAVNMYKKYIPDDPVNSDGQKKPYISSRINPDGSAIQSVEAIPHNPIPEANGTQVNSSYGDTPEVTFIDGHGNGGNALRFTNETIKNILQNGIDFEPTYKRGAGPLNVKVIDPLNVKGGYYELVFNYNLPNNPKIYQNKYFETDTASWTLNRYDKPGGTLLDQVHSEQTIAVGGEQLIPDWGISVDIIQNKYYDDKDHEKAVPAMNYKGNTTDIISGTMDFADSTKRWLTGIPDDDQFFPTNWIMSGTDTSKSTNPIDYLSQINYQYLPGDVNKAYSRILGGTFGPMALTNYRHSFAPVRFPNGQNMSVNPYLQPAALPSVRLVITADKSKWTRCPVIELAASKNVAIGNAVPGLLRQSPSVDKEGNSLNDGTYGLGWFPGYALDMETGARLQLAFGESSFLQADGGGDMIWDPSSRIVDNSGNPIMGGLQPVYILGYQLLNQSLSSKEPTPYYDVNNMWAYNKLMTGTLSSLRDFYRSIAWVYFPLRAQGHEMLETDVTIDVNINKEYYEFTRTGRNDSKPMFGFSLNGLEPQLDDRKVMADEGLDLINVVPNPYYAYSAYETGRLDTRVKITNLPDKCTIHIYNVAGQLIKTFKKDSPITSVEWDLKNNAGTPISSGVYLIHVSVPNVGDRIIKFFGGMRRPDMENI